MKNDSRHANAPRGKRFSVGLACAVLLLTTPPPIRAAVVRNLTSPDARIQVTLHLPGGGAAERPHWSATFLGKPILTHCHLGLHIADTGDLLARANIVRERSRTVNERVPVLFGKTDQAQNHFNESRFTLQIPDQRRVDLVFRCYNDAVALRYELPATDSSAPVIITNETTSFRLPGEPTVYVQYLEHFRTSHEHHVTPTPYADIRPDKLIDLPLTAAWPDGTTLAITEAALRRYAGMSLRRSAATPSDELACELTPGPDGTKVKTSAPMKTPWRVALIGDRPGALLESTAIYCLNDPPAFDDTSWIRPDKITFPWWNGDVYNGKRDLPILSFDMAKRYIDFCASNGLGIHSMTSTEESVTPWYYQSKPGVVPGPDTDVTRPRPGFDLEAIRQYAESNNVRLWTWAHHGAVRGRVDEAFAAFERLGWSGIMVDFMDHDDQDTVEFTEAVLAAAARHHILVHLHGAWKPTGLERTYPNLMNHEGALNLEYLKWSDDCPPEHTLLMAFTRLIAGPMDYHLGGFRAVPRSAFKPHNVAPQVLGTRGHMLAMYVCFDNPAPMIADYPAAYEGQPGFDFLKRVPTWWNETRVLQSQIGEFLVTARRKDTTWYLGGLSAKAVRNLELPLSFLPPGEFKATVWKDADDTDLHPNHLVQETPILNARDTLHIRLAVDGGFVAELAPVQN